MNNPSVEQQDKLVERAKADMLDLLGRLFEGPEHKPLRLMVKRLLPIMAETPASPSEKWHDAYPGGLLVHTSLVVETGFSIVINVAFGTSTPTSTTEVATSTWTSPEWNACIIASFSCAPRRPWIKSKRNSASSPFASCSNA